ncbi:hypothetical protein ACFL0Y_03225 [Patescibacteria group bacterium]
MTPGKLVSPEGKVVATTEKGSSNLIQNNSRVVLPLGKSAAYITDTDEGFIVDRQVRITKDGGEVDIPGLSLSKTAYREGSFFQVAGGGALVATRRKEAE